MQQQCPNAFQMGSALLSVLGPAASPGWSLQPALGMRCSRPRGPGLGTCWGDRHQSNASGQCRALRGPWMGMGLCRGHQWVRPQPGCTQGKVGCSSGDLSGNDPIANSGSAGEDSPAWEGPAGSVPGMQRGSPRGGDAQPAVPQPRTCPRGRRVPSGRWPRGSAGPVRPGSRGVRQHMIRAAGPRAEVSQSHPGSGTDFTAGRSSSSRIPLPEGSADPPLGAHGQAAPLSGRGHRSHRNAWLPGASPGSHLSQHSSSGPVAEGQSLTGSCRCRWGSRSAGSFAVLPVRLAGLVRFPGAMAGWDQPLAEVIESPFHLSRVWDEHSSASCLAGAMARAGGPRRPRLQNLRGG